MDARKVGEDVPQSNSLLMSSNTEELNKITELALPCNRLGAETHQ